MTHEFHPFLLLKILVPNTLLQTKKKFPFDKKKWTSGAWTSIYLLTKCILALPYFDNIYIFCFQQIELTFIYFK